MEDLRGDWPCAWCDTDRVAKRGTICAPCQLRLDHGRRFHDDDMPLLPDEPASYSRPWQDVKPKGEFL